VNEVRFLTVAEVLLIHQDQISRYGGSLGLRDASLLSSAVAMPEAQFSGKYLHEDIFEMAAAYLFHLCQNHAFIDGNKRVSLAACLVFLDLNGVFLEDNDGSFYDMVIDVTLGKMRKPEIASLLRKMK
jgi:death-on-curing protein